MMSSLRSTHGRVTRRAAPRGPSSSPPEPATASGRSGPRRSWRSGSASCSPRASSGSTPARGSTRSSSRCRKGGKRRRSCWPRSSSPRRWRRSSPGAQPARDSVRAALAEVRDDALVVIVHDAARPLVDDEVIERVLGPLGDGAVGRGTGPAGRRHPQARRARAGSSRPSTGATSSPFRRRRRSSPRRSGPPMRAISPAPPIARPSSRRSEAGSTSSPATRGC